jgi:hypothetical protein
MTPRRDPFLPSPVETELAQERASALGRAGSRVEAAIANLEAGTPGALAEATRATWAYLIQREACGLNDHRRVIAEYRIPRAVMTRLGAAPVVQPTLRKRRPE